MLFHHLMTTPRCYTGFPVQLLRHDSNLKLFSSCCMHCLARSPSQGIYYDQLNTQVVEMISQSSDADSGTDPLAHLFICFQPILC